MKNHMRGSLSSLEMRSANFDVETIDFVIRLNSRLYLTPPAVVPVSYQVQCEAVYHTLTPSRISLLEQYSKVHVAL